MTIKLQCSACGKKIEAPDSAGGKWGKCPGCHMKIYVPLPAPADEELKLAPLDETEEQQQKRLMQETWQLTQHILEEKEVPDAPGSVGPSPEISDEALTNHIIHYLRQMANGDLDTAQRTADLIVPHRRKAMAVLDQFIRHYPPDPELEDIPERVLSGLIRNLRTRIS